MLRSALELNGYQIAATDGELGTVHDLLFDDAQGIVRYLVVDTGSWLPGRRVLISPTSLGQPDWARQRFPVDLTKQQIENSPSIAADEPVSRQREKELVEYFEWPMYWAPAAFTMGSIGSGSPPPAVAPQEEAAATEGAPQPSGDPHLRSVREVTGYKVQAADGEIGHVDDFIVDDDGWTIRYSVIDTRNWLPGRKVILAPHWFERFDWHEGWVHTKLAKEKIRNAPAYDPTQPVTRDYEDRLYDYYGAPGYWTMAAAPGVGWRI